MSERPWGGRFTGQTDVVVDAFLRSLQVDRRLWPHDIRASRAYARALAKAGVLSDSEAEQIDQGLLAVATDLQLSQGKPLEGEDIHMLVESMLIGRIGALGGKLHTGRSRNDQVATDLRLYCKEAGSQIDGRLRDLQQALVAQAEANIDLVLPGYTHLQRAQPVLLAHHLLAYVEMLRRDRHRLADALARADQCPLGSGALAGSGVLLDRVELAASLGFAAVCSNSMDAVSDRDFAIELTAGLSLVMAHLSRLGEEIVLWTSGEFGFAELPDSLATGSSMMPNKKNPCAAELIRGKSARVFGSLVALLTMVKGLPLTYNRDLQEDKEALFDAVDTVLSSLQVMAILIAGLRFHAENMRLAVLAGYTLATEVADYLVTKGLPFRDAHRVVGRAVADAVAMARPLESLSLDQWKSYSPLFEEDLGEHLTLAAALNSHAVVGGTAPDRVREAIERAKT